MALDTVWLTAAIAGGVVGLAAGLACGFLVCWRGKCSCCRTSALSPVPPAEHPSDSWQEEAPVVIQSDTSAPANQALGPVVLSPGGCALPASVSLPQTIAAEDASEAVRVMPGVSSEAILPALPVSDNEKGSHEADTGTKSSPRTLRPLEIHVSSPPAARKMYAQAPAAGGSK